MNKKILIPLVLVILALMAGSVWLFLSLQEQKQVNQDMQELAELDKQGDSPSEEGACYRACRVARLCDAD